MQHHLVVPQSLAAFDEAEIPDHAIMAAAHSSQPAIPKTPHRLRMHCETIPSILDESREAIAGEMRPNSSVTGHAPEPNHVQRGKSADAGKNRKAREPDPLPAFLVSEERRAARAEHRRQACDQEDLASIATSRE